MGLKLTRNQEKFVHELVSGKNQRDAYMNAYPASKKWKLQSVDSAANRLINQPHVQEKYDELMSDYHEHVKEQTFYDRDQLLNDFMYLKDESKESIENFGVRQANSNAYVSALKNIGEILDLYPDKKQNVKVDANVKTTDMNPFESLTEDELMLLIAERAEEEDKKK